MINEDDIEQYQSKILLKSKENGIGGKLIDKISIELIKNGNKITYNKMKEKLILVTIKLKDIIKFQDNKMYLEEGLENTIILV